MSQPPFIRNPHLDGSSFYWTAGPTGVLMIHGFTATTAEVRLIGRWLHERGYTVAAPLLPGHGTTPAEMNRCRWQDWANAVEQAYRQLAGVCERVFVAGESMGALLALYLASEHPAIAGILAYAPAILLSDGRVWKARLMSPFVQYAQKPVRAPNASDPHWKGYTVNPLRAVLQLGHLQREVRRRLPRVQQPISVMQGRLDQTIHPQSGEVILSEVASTVKELHWLEQSTHCLALDCEWEQAAALSLQFIERVVVG